MKENNFSKIDFIERYLSQQYKAGINGDGYGNQFSLHRHVYYLLVLPSTHTHTHTQICVFM